MTRYLFIILPAFLTACGTKTADKNEADFEPINDTSAIFQVGFAPDKSVEEDTDNYDNATFFIVVADTGQDYSTLQKKMADLNSQLAIPIDTMGRFYNKTKDLIALPDNDEDEMYAGDYFPRRFPSEWLSLEYLNFYRKQAGEKTIALVTGIYELEKDADSVLTVLHKVEKKPFKIKADIYLGCMH